MHCRQSRNRSGFFPSLYTEVCYKLLCTRLLAVPFKIVAKAREIAERKRKTGANERRVFLLAPVSPRCALSVCTLSRLSRKGLLAVYLCT